MAYAEQGYIAEAFLNFLALLGWSPGDDREILSREELIGLFTLEAVGKANAVFGIEKLEWSGDRLSVIGDQDEAAIDQRHNIYYDMETGTLAGCIYYKEISKKNNGVPKIIELDGAPGVKEVSADLISQLDQ